jgi:hypothetical protein
VRQVDIGNIIHRRTQTASWWSPRSSRSR